jgi:hypothetical protein
MRSPVVAPGPAEAKLSRQCSAKRVLSVELGGVSGPFAVTRCGWLSAGLILHPSCRARASYADALRVHWIG